MIDKQTFDKILIHAKNILNESAYKTQKKAIRELFDKTQDKSKEDVLLRLVTIDSCYSTNMNKRLFAFEDLTELTIELDDELELIKNEKDVQKFIEKNLNKDILLRNIGIDKRGKNKGHAFSLISKYTFFRTKYNFPIYDRLVFEGLGFKGQREPSKKYFEELIRLKKELKTSFDDLDKFFWVCGKIREDNLSLLFQNAKSYTAYRNGEFRDETADTIQKIKDIISSKK